MLTRLLCSTAFLLPASLVYSPAALAAQIPEPQPDAPPALASQSRLLPETTDTPPIIVTGSRIPRKNLTAVSPVTVVRQEEVKLEGAVATEELLNQLPQVAPSQGAFVSSNATGTATVDLRGLGAARTLVLINGRRLGPGDPFGVPDLNMVPATLIQRVEVLTGGASSVYGSDAVSGVVNFILDTRLDGLRLDGQASVFQHENRNGSGLRDALVRSGYQFPIGNVVDGGRQDINIAFGRSFFDGRAHVTLYAGYRRFEPLTQSRRDYSACTAVVDGEVDNALLECGGSTATFPGNFFTFFDIFQIGPDRTFVPGVEFFNFGPWNFYQRSDRRYSGGGFADYEISDALKSYLEVMYLDDRSLAQVAPSGDFRNTSSINCDNPLLSEQQRSLVCFAGNFVGQFPDFDANGRLVGIEGSPQQFRDPLTGASYLRGRLFVDRRGVETGPRQEDLRHQTVRLLGGLKGDFGRGVSYDASYLFARARISAAHLNDYSVTRLRRALDVVTDPATGQPACRSALIADEIGPTAPGADADCVPWDIFALGAMTPNAAAYLKVPSFRHGAVKEQVANANATVDLGQWSLRSPWAEEAPAINFGAEYRKDTLDYVPDQRAQIADLAGSGEDFPVHGSVDVKELFAEARVPLLTDRFVERLAVEVGYRQSWYGNSESSFATNAYKLALDLTAVRGLRFRASHQRAVRAPNIVELFTPRIQSEFEIDRCAGVSPQATETQCALTGVSAAEYGHVLAIPQDADFYHAFIGGNPDLDPETATTRTLGVVLQPRFLRGFSATIDWWSIELEGAILPIGAQAIMDTCIATGDPLFCNRIHRDTGGSLWLSPEGFIDDRNANVGSLKVRGIDVGTNYRRDLGRAGSGTIEFLGTYVDKHTVDLGGLSELFDCAGRFGGNCRTPTPKWRHTARVTWDGRGGTSLSFRWRYWAKMTLKPFPDLPPAGPFSTDLTAQSFFDFSALFKVQRQYVLRLGVNNIFDREPPLLPTGEGACSGGCNGNTYSQWFDPLGRYIFAGFTANF